MKCKEIIPNLEAPFAECKLGREPYANTLTSIVEAYSDGFVLAVNGKWGTGKTTFMRMWEKSLANKGYKTVFFNAWENDFTSEPLVAILGELRSIIESDAEKGFNTILDIAYKFSGKMLPVLAKTAATIAGIGQVSEVLENFSEATIQAFNSEIANYEKKRKSLSELKTELSQFVKKQCGDKPLVFIVDELDRCRPNYAVEVLEKIKHFFSVDGVVFVLSVDKEQLCNAIKGFYGSDSIDSPEYLRRFIDIEYTIPEPNYEQFCKYLYEEYKFDDFFKSPSRLKSGLDGDIESLLKATTILTAAQGLSLRQIQKLFVQMRVAIRMFRSNNYVYPDLLFLMIYIKLYYQEIYQKLVSCQFTIQELVEHIEAIFEVIIRNEKDNKYSQSFHFAVAKLLIFYRNELPQKPPLTTSASSDNKLSFRVGMLDADKILRSINHINQNIDSFDIRLTYFTNKIDLLDPLNS